MPSFTSWQYEGGKATHGEQRAAMGDVLIDDVLGEVIFVRRIDAAFLCIETDEVDEAGKKMQQPRTVGHLRAKAQRAAPAPAPAAGRKRKVGGDSQGSIFGAFGIATDDPAAQRAAAAAKPKNKSTRKGFGGSPSTQKKAAGGGGGAGSKKAAAAAAANGMGLIGKEYASSGDSDGGDGDGDGDAGDTEPANKKQKLCLTLIFGRNVKIVFMEILNVVYCSRRFGL
jgi:hypothetical protein